jgi:hypothetical protein
MLGSSTDVLGYRTESVFLAKWREFTCPPAWYSRNLKDPPIIRTSGQPLWWMASTESPNHASPQNGTWTRAILETDPRTIYHLQLMGTRAYMIVSLKMLRILIRIDVCAWFRRDNTVPEIDLVFQHHSCRSKAEPASVPT